MIADSPSKAIAERLRDAALRLGVSFPLVQAGMGGVAGPELAAAVSDAGALGTLGLYRLPSEACRAALQETMKLTSFTFGVNLIPEVAGEELLAAQLHAVLETVDRPIVVNIYGRSPTYLPARVRRYGHTVAVQLGELGELADADADVLIAQGVEAGGHHLGTTPIRPLLKAVTAARPGIPVLAAGGVSSAASLTSALRSGAWGVQAGTIFAATRESRAHPRYKQRLIEAEAEDTCISDRFDFGWPGRPHRVLRNEVTRAESAPAPDFVAVSRDASGRRHPIPRGSANVPTTVTTGSIDEMALYAGLGVGSVSSLTPVADLVASLRDEVELALATDSQLA